MQCSDNVFLNLCSLGFILMGLVNRAIYSIIIIVSVALPTVAKKAQNNVIELLTFVYKRQIFA